MEDSFTKELTRLKNAIKRRIRTLKKSLKKALEQLKACQDWQNLHHTAELIQSQMHRLKKGEEKIVVPDWEREGSLVTIQLDPRLKPFEDVAKRYKKAGKLKKGLPFAIKELERVNEALASHQVIWDELQKIETEEELEALHLTHPLPAPQEKKARDDKTPPKPYLEYISESGICIWVGKNGAKNDQLTFQYASGNDLWLHVADYPGSHVVIHPKGKQEIDEATLKKAQQLALYYSKARQAKEGEVVVTQVKYVRRLGKEKGKVQIAQEKRVFVRLKTNF